MVAGNDFQGIVMSHVSSSQRQSKQKIDTNLVFAARLLESLGWKTQLLECRNFQLNVSLKGPLRAVSIGWYMAGGYGGAMAIEGGEDGEWRFFLVENAKKLERIIFSKAGEALWINMSFTSVNSHSNGKWTLWRCFSSIYMGYSSLKC